MLHQEGMVPPAPQLPRLLLNLIFDYPLRWSRIPRHAWAERFSHRIEQQRLTLVSEGVDFSDDWLIPIGASTKRDGGV
jgi:hypothetical protein